MAGIIYDSSKVKAFENLKALCSFAGETQEWCDALWMEMVQDDALYGEFLYYLKHNTLHDGMSCCGYTLIDLFIWQMEHYNLLHDTGKNTEECRKTDMVLRALDMMAKMKKDPETYKKRLEEGRGNDQF